MLTVRCGPTTQTTTCEMATQTDQECTLLTPANQLLGKQECESRPSSKEVCDTHPRPAAAANATVQQARREGTGRCTLAVEVTEAVPANMPMHSFISLARKLQCRQTSEYTLKGADISDGKLRITLPRHGRRHNHTGKTRVLCILDAPNLARRAGQISQRVPLSQVLKAFQEPSCTDAKGGWHSVHELQIRMSRSNQHVGVEDLEHAMAQLERKGYVTKKDKLYMLNG